MAISIVTAVTSLSDQRNLSAEKRELGVMSYRAVSRLRLGLVLASSAERSELTTRTLQQFQSPSSAPALGAAFAPDAHAQIGWLELGIALAGSGAERVSRQAGAALW